MNDTENTTQNAEDAVAQEKRAAILKTLKTEFYVGQEAFDKAGGVIEMVQAAGIPLRMNYDLETVDFPAETHGMLIQVLKHRVAKKTVPTGEVLVAAVPTVEAVGNSGEAGEAFLMESVEGILASRVVNAVRAATPGAESFIPFTVEDFITKRTITSEYGDYNKLSKIFVAALKKGKGFEILTPSILRNVLMSTEMANSIFPNVPQEWWIGVIGKMTEYCGKASPELETEIFETWLETRDEVSSADEVKELSLDDLGLELESALSADAEEADAEEDDDDDEGDEQPTE